MWVLAILIVLFGLLYVIYKFSSTSNKHKTGSHRNNTPATSGSAGELRQNQAQQIQNKSNEYEEKRKNYINENARRIALSVMQESKHLNEKGCNSLKIEQTHEKTYAAYNDHDNFDGSYVILDEYILMAKQLLTNEGFQNVQIKKKPKDSYTYNVVIQVSW